MLKLAIAGTVMRPETKVSAKGTSYNSYTIMSDSPVTYVQCMDFRDGQPLPNAGDVVYATGKPSASAYTDKKGELRANFQMFVDSCVEMLSTNPEAPSAPVKKTDKKFYPEPQKKTVPEDDIPF